MSVEGEGTAAAGAAKKGALGLLGVIAKWLAPLIGLLIGLAGGKGVGGAWSIGHELDMAISPPNGNPANHRWEDAVAGAIMFTIFGGLGAVMWHIPLDGHVILMMVTRFIAGLFFGIGVMLLILGLIGQPSPGLLDTFIQKISSAVPPALGGGGATE